MRHSAIIDLDPVEPVRIGFRQARGAQFVCDFTFRLPEVSGVAADGPVQQLPTAQATLDENPQIVFRPKSKAGAWGYNIEVIDLATGRGRVTIDGGFFQDPNGYLVELYTRDSAGHPDRLIAHGEMAMTGGAYAYEGPLGPMTLPVVAGPQGPAGPQGVPGVPGIRGGTWTTGSGDPVAPGGVEGDMYLNVENGDVWRWSGSAWMVGSFG